MSKIKLLFTFILLLLSIKLGLNLRRDDISKIPEPYVILDEHTNVWHGLSLIKTGVPTAWSIMPFYKELSKTHGAGGKLEGLNLTVDDQKPSLLNFNNFPKPSVGVKEFDFGRGLSQTQIVQPYIDHPPLGALVLSLGSLNITNFSDLDDYRLRMVSIYLGILTQFLIFAVAYVYTKKIFLSILSSFLYATVPSYLLLSRYAQLENVLTPIILTAFLLLLLVKDKTNLKLKYQSTLLVIAGFVAGSGALVKLVGWIYILAFSVILFYWKFSYRNILKFLLPAIFVGSLYFIWGIYLSKDMFLAMFVSQGSRDFIGAINLVVTMMKVSILNFPVDGWWVGGFISLFIITKHKENLPITILFIFSLIAALFVVGSNYPWYFVPIIPLMVIATAMVFDKFIFKPNLQLLLIIFFVFFSSSLYWGFGVYNLNYAFNVYRLSFVVFIASYLFLKHNKRLWTGFSVVLVILLVVLNVQSVNYILDNWGKLPLIYTPGTF